MNMTACDIFTIYQVTNLLNRMQLHAEQSVSGDKSSITISVPPTRSDVLHPCDVMEVWSE